jgi:hypothetical protein
MAPTTIKESYRPYKSSNIGPKIGPTPAYLKLESRSFIAVHGNKIYSIGVGVAGSSVSIWFKYAFDKFTVKHIQY